MFKSFLEEEINFNPLLSPFHFLISRVFLSPIPRTWLYPTSPWLICLRGLYRWDPIFLAGVWKEGPDLLVPHLFQGQLCNIYSPLSDVRAWAAKNCRGWVLILASSLTCCRVFRYWICLYPTGWMLAPAFTEGACKSLELTAWSLLSILRRKMRHCFFSFLWARSFEKI